jgi:aconitate hydratase
MRESHAVAKNARAAFCPRCRKSLRLKGDEEITIKGLSSGLKPLAEVPATIRYADGSQAEITLRCRIDTAVELEYVEHGGVLHYVLRSLAQAA